MYVSVSSKGNMVFGFFKLSLESTFYQNHVYDINIDYMLTIS